MFFPSLPQGLGSKPRSATLVCAEAPGKSQWKLRQKRWRSLSRRIPPKNVESIVDNCSNPRTVRNIYTILGKHVSIFFGGLLLKFLRSQLPWFPPTAAGQGVSPNHYVQKLDLWQRVVSRCSPLSWLGSWGKGRMLWQNQHPTWIYHGYNMDALQ